MGLERVPAGSAQVGSHAMPQRGASCGIIPSPVQGRRVCLGHGSTGMIPACLPPPTIRNGPFRTCSGALPHASLTRRHSISTVRPSVTVNSMTLTTRFALALRKLGVQTGNVALMLPEHPQAVIAYYGAMKAGAVVVPMNPLRRARNSDSTSRTRVARPSSPWIFCIHASMRRSRASRPAKADHCHQFARLFADGKSCCIRHKHGGRSAGSWWRRLHRCMVFLNFSILCPVATEAETSSLALCGTHQPGPDSVHRRHDRYSQRVMLTHRNVVVSALQGRRWCSNFREGQEVFLGAVPLFHCYGLSTCQNLAVATGSRIVLLPAFNRRGDDGDSETWDQHHVRCADDVLDDDRCGAPARPAFDPGLSLRASPLSADVQDAFERLSGVTISEGHGLTEARPTTHRNPIQGPHPHGSMGCRFQIRTHGLSM